MNRQSITIEERPGRVPAEESRRAVALSASAKCRELRQRSDTLRGALGDLLRRKLSLQANDTHRAEYRALDAEIRACRTQIETVEALSRRLTAIAREYRAA